MIGIALYSSCCRACWSWKLPLCCLNKVPTASLTGPMFENWLHSTKATKPASSPYTMQDDFNQEKQKLASSPLPNFFDTNSNLNNQEVRVLYEVLDEIVNDIGNLSFVNEASIANERVQTCVKYVLPSGLMSATIFLAADRFYAKQRQANGKPFNNEQDHFRLTSVLCWTIHMYLVHAAMQDDILDGNHGRNNLKSWHLLDGNEKHAIRDIELIKDLIFIILKKYFKSKEYYIDLVDMMHECMYCSYIGISEMEIIQPSTDPYKPKSADLLKPGKKYAYCVFPYQAIAAAMIVNGVNTSDINGDVREICLDMCLIAGLSEDYIDCYGDKRVNERDTTDISEGKQTWLYWKALELATPEQAKLLMKSYGKNNEECVKQVKSIYLDIKLKENMAHTLEALEQKFETKISLHYPKHPDAPWPVLLDFMKYFRGVRAGTFSRP